MSIIEAYATDQLSTRAERQVPAPRAKILETIYVAAEDRALASWPALKETYNTWLGIRLHSYPSWVQLQATIDARNAIAHGLGLLTRRQTRKNEGQLISSLGKIGINVHSGRLAIPDSAVRGAARRGRDFVAWLDDQLAAYDT